MFVSFDRLGLLISNSLAPGLLVGLVSTISTMLNSFSLVPRVTLRTLTSFDFGSLFNRGNLSLELGLQLKQYGKRNMWRLREWHLFIAEGFQIRMKLSTGGHGYHG